MHRKFILAALLLVGFVSCADGNDGISIGEIDLTKLNWGLQTFELDVTNSGEYLRFLVVETDVLIEGHYLTPHRATRSSYFVEPGSSKKVNPTILIPPAYGNAQIFVRVHDVIDTLDDVLPNQTILEQPFRILFRTPEAMIPFLQERYDLPPRVEEHPYFDTEFSRLLLAFLNEGKSISEIAAMADCDSAFVLAEAEKMVAEGYILHTEDGNGYRLSFPVIRLAEAEATKPLADAIIDSLVAMYERNLPELAKTIDSLVAAGAMNSDTSDFLNPGGILFHPYPTVGGFSMWYDIGRRFITRSAPLSIYDGTDPCNAHIPFYMYMVEGGPSFHGSHFYHYQPSRRSVTIYYGDTLPEIACDPDFLRKKQQNLHVNWSHASDNLPEVFSVDTGVVRVGLNTLAEGADSLVTYAYFALKEIAEEYGHKKVSFGHRYWFWNYVATRALDRLRDKGVVTRRGKGQYRFESFPGAR